MKRFLPYGHQQIDDDDVAAVVAALRSDFLTTGPAVGRFEQELARKTGANAAVSCSSGTAALHLAAMALDLGPGDRAVVPAVTFLATANAVRYVGADVVFADVDPDSGLMRPADLSNALSAAGGPVKAVFPVHLAGQCGDAPRLREIAAAAGARVAEDACHALGTTYERNGRRVEVGSCADSDLAVFSFHPVKTITTGEGGALTTNDPALAERLAMFRNHGMVKQTDRLQNAELAFAADGSVNPWYYEMPEVGFNYRASDLHCALGLSQLGKLDAFVARRRTLAAQYDQGLAVLAPLVRPIVRTPGCEPAWHLYIVLIDFAAIGQSRAKVMERLRAAGIGTQVHYVPVPWQPYYRKLYGPMALPGAAAFYERCLSLPLYPGMTTSDVDFVVETLSGIVKQ